MCAALNPNIKLPYEITDRQIAAGLVSPQELYQSKLAKRALHNLKLIKAKQHYSNVSYFSNSQRKQQELEREKRLIEEKKQCERLAKRIMRKTGKTPDSLLSCNAESANQKTVSKKVKRSKKKKVRLLTDHSNTAIRSAKTDAPSTNKHYSSDQPYRKEQLIRKTTFQDAANAVLRDQRPLVYHSRLDTKRASTSGYVQNSKPTLMQTKSNNMVNTNAGPKLKGILKNNNNRSFKFGY